jgi:RES domain-containing protein
MTPRQRRFQRILTTLGEARRGSFVRAIRLARQDVPLSAAGSVLYGGHYNARGGFEALYLADDSDTATAKSG